MTKTFALLLILLLIPLQAFAASFNATVESKEIPAGEGFTLQLDLSGAKAKNDPDFSSLKSLFDVVGQSRSSSTTIINGQINSSNGWLVTLIPKEAGKLTLPALSVDTDKGIFSSQPITLNVSHPSDHRASAATPGDANPEVSIKASSNISAPYQEEPVILTVRIEAKKDLYDLSLGDVTADNGIVKVQGQPKERDEVENGVPVKTIELRYLVTPVKAGSLRINPVTIRGTVESSNSSHAVEGLQNGFMDPAALFEQMSRFSGLAERKPFALSSNPVTLDVKPPAVTMDSWLPLKDLRITEKPDPVASVKAGEAITRSFTLEAVGAPGSRIPSVESQLEMPNVKVYPDGPQTSEDVIGGDVIGRRVETFNIIPTQAGPLMFPEIKIPWWDIKNNRLSYARVPGRTINVQPGSPETTKLDVAGQNDAQLPPATENPAAVQMHAKRSVLAPIWYVLIGAMVASTLLLSLWRFSLRRKQNQSNAETAPTRKSDLSESSMVHSPDLDWEKILTTEDLRRAVLSYSRARWGLPAHVDIESALELLRSKLPNSRDREVAHQTARDLAGALYAGKNVDLNVLKVQCQSLLHLLEKVAKEHPVTMTDRLPRLNPS